MNRSRNAAIIAMTVLLVGAAILVVNRRSKDVDPAAPEAGRTAQTARITSPVMGGTVRPLSQISGVVTGLATDEVIWMVVQPAGSNVLRPASKPCTTNGNKLTCSNVEFDAPGIADIIPIMANRNGQAALRASVDSAAVTEHPAGLPQLPDGTWQWGPHVTVTRQ